MPSLAAAYADGTPSSLSRPASGSVWSATNASLPDHSPGRPIGIVHINRHPGTHQKGCRLIWTIPNRAPGAASTAGRLARDERGARDTRLGALLRGCGGRLRPRPADLS